MINNKTPNLENRQFYNFHCCFSVSENNFTMQHFTAFLSLSLVSASLGNNGSIFSNKPSLVELEGKHVPQKVLKTETESILILFQTLMSKYKHTKRNLIGFVL